MSGTMKFLVFIAPNNYKDETLSIVRMFFDRWGVQYAISSYSTKPCVGVHGATVNSDINTAKVSAADYDGVVLVDGKGVDDYKLFEYRPLLDLILHFNESKKLVCAVDSAIKVVARANIIKGRNIATPQDEEAKRVVQLFHGAPTDKSIEISGNVVTIRSSQNMEGSMQELLKHIGVL
jgi:putative intracellular protease/amidase